MKHQHVMLQHCWCVRVKHVRCFRHSKLHCSAFYGEGSGPSVPPWWVLVSVSCWCPVRGLNGFGSDHVWSFWWFSSPGAHVMIILGLNAEILWCFVWSDVPAVPAESCRWMSMFVVTFFISSAPVTPGKRKADGKEKGTPPTKKAKADGEGTTTPLNQDPKCSGSNPVRTFKATRDEHSTWITVWFLKIVKYWCGCSNTNENVSYKLPSSQ